jgi:hypothetical protein
MLDTCVDGTVRNRFLLALCLDVKLKKIYMDTVFVVLSCRVLNSNLRLFFKKLFWLYIS